MGRACTVCRHPQRAELDSRLIAGEPSLRIAAEYRDISEDALDRHRKSHLPAHLAQAREAAEVADADRLLDQIRDLHAHCLFLLGAGSWLHDPKTTLAAIREARECLRLEAELLGKLREQGSTVQVAIVQSPEWLRVRTALLDALAPYPDARTAVAAALTSVEAGDALAG